MQIEGLSWFPGHMTKTKRMIAAEIGHMDAVCEIVDARIPQSSRNPDVDELTAGKPRMIVLNRVDQADPAETKKWAAAFRAQGYAVLEANAKGGAGTEKFAAAVRELLKEKLAAYAEKGQVGRTIRVMGTLGELEGDSVQGTIEVKPFNSDEVETIDVSKQLVGHVGHAGGDTRLVDNIIDILRKDDLEHNLTSIDASVHSHVMALAAEESRVNHGKSISIREFESKF